MTLSKQKELLRKLVKKVAKGNLKRILEKGENR